MGKKVKEERTLTYKGVTYEITFNLNVMEEIQEEYGSLERWSELTEEAIEPNARAVKFGMTKMLNEGIDIYNETHEDKREPFTAKQVGRLVYEVGLERASEALSNAVIDSTKSDEKN